MIKTTAHVNKLIFLLILPILFILNRTDIHNKNIVKSNKYGFILLSVVDPSICQDIRYATTRNFVGCVIPGYKRKSCMLTIQTALALKKVQKRLKKKLGKNFSLKVYDGYRPQKACDFFWKWSHNVKDIKMKSFFYPNITSKKNLFRQGYIAKKSSHSRGSTVDITIIDLRKSAFNPKTFQDNSIEMGTIFDYFGEESYINNKLVSRRAQQNRRLLCKLMTKNGFIAYEKEWWHFTLKNESYPNRYFNFDID